jgi:hypothetical protein
MVMALSSHLIAGFPPQERDADTGASACVLGTVWGTVWGRRRSRNSAV